MIRQIHHRIVLLATALLVVCATPAAARQWSDRTVVTFSEAVQIPGATLPPGSYVFRLVDPTSSQDVITVTSKDGTKVFATFHTVPMRRPQPADDMIVLFNPTVEGTPPALKGWYVPGGRHGYELVYSEDEARTIAERTKSIVLSRDVPDSTAGAGSLVVFDQSGTSRPWQPDPAVQREWDDWRERRESTAPMVAGQQTAPKIMLDNLESEPQRFYGREISVDGKVQEVLGPHLFKIDEPHWADLQEEVLVVAPEHLVALVREDDGVTVTGTVKAFMRSDLHRETSWLELDDEIVAELSVRPVIIATKIVGGDSNRVLILDVNAEAATTLRPGGTMAPITDLAALANGDEPEVGRHVQIDQATVDEVSDLGGFVIRAGDRRLFVLTRESARPSFAAGATVSVTGVVLDMPDELEDRLERIEGINDEIYVYAVTTRSR